ncbi:MAG TPA: MltA domain-containing protein [Nostocaceae cyanobacterium]|nr:MltA domain-containing protein [Nostocaceae cyanobacterium]
MKKTIGLITLGLPVSVLIYLSGLQATGNLALIPPECQVKKWDLPTPKTTPTLIQRTPVTCCQNDISCLDDAIFNSDKQGLLTAIDRSLGYLQTQAATKAYQKYPITGITRDRVLQSLLRFRELLLTTNSATELQQAVEKEFVFYQSIGNDSQGTVLFTAYFEPLYLASRIPTPEFRYPVYRQPPNLASWPLPHPTRLELEGADGLQGSKGKLKGLELFWLRDRLEPYMIQIQGSARLQLTDNTQATINYAGNTAYTYKSIGRELINDGKLPQKGVTMPKILDYFQKYPQDLNIYIPRDSSFVFFRETYGAPAQGSIGVPITAERSIATDKSLMPPGALALIRAPFPFIDNSNKVEHRIISRFVLDQDTGGAIKGAGRVDYFLGTGKIAGDRAGLTVSNGHLFYLLLKPKKIQSLSNQNTTN